MLSNRRQRRSRTFSLIALAAIAAVVLGACRTGESDATSITPTAGVTIVATPPGAEPTQIAAATVPAPVPSQIPFPTARPATAGPTVIPRGATPAIEATAPVIRRQEIPSPPAKDVYELGRRLLLKTSESPPKFTDPPPPPLREGDVIEMWVDRNNGAVMTQAVVARVSENAYWLFDSRVDYDITDIDTAAAEFESNIWPTVTGTFGPVWTPGIDGDPHLLILHTRVRSGVGGYFSAADSYPKSIQKFSNEREIIYISSDGPAPGTRPYLATLTHELQHAVHWAADPNEDTWLNEGLSELSSEIAGFRAATISEYLRRPSVSLTEWAQSIGSAGPNYGAAALFSEYLVDHYGGDAAARAIVMEQADGLVSIDHFLAGAGYTERALDVFRDWLVANYLDEPSGRYSYPRRDLKSGVRLLTQFVLTDTEVEGEVEPMGADFYSVSIGPGDIALNFKGQPNASLFPVAPASGETCWWGNAGDSVDTTLTRRVDLTSLASNTPASVEYSIWHDIEPEFDFAYVEVSVDGGSTWDILPATGTTDDNPNGGSYGWGYTGANRKWSPESADLSKYSGQSFLLRFEYITDDAVHGRGLCLDDFSLVAAGWSDDTETAGDWQAEGFARVNDRIPQDYLLITVRQPVDGPTNVSQVTVGPDGIAAATITGVSDGEKLAVIVSPVTAGAAGPATYSLSFTRSRP